MIPAPIHFIEFANINESYLARLKKSPWAGPEDFNASIIKGCRSAYITAIEFLISRSSNQITVATYLSELERFLQWCFRVRKLPPAKLGTSDLMLFLEFRRNPFTNWISATRQKKIRVVKGEKCINPNWRPFVACSKAEPSIAALTKTFVAIDNYYRFLCEIKIIRYNPLLNVNPYVVKPAPQDRRPVRIFEKKEINLIKLTLNKLVKEDRRFTRERFLVFSMLYMGLKVSDLATYNGETVMMSDFSCDLESRWTFRAYGYRAKRRVIPANNQVMGALVEYRKYLRLNSYPSYTDKSPLVASKNGYNFVRSTREINRIIGNVLKLVLKEAKKTGWSQDDTKPFQQGSASWLSNTADKIKDESLLKFRGIEIFQ